MLEELTVIGVTAEGVVTRIATLARGGLVRMPGARFIIELPLHCKAPQPGDRLVYTRTRRPVRSSDPPKVGP